MGEILSQSEIDELLSQLKNGNANNLVIEESSPKKQAKDYDFAIPSKFNKDQLRALEVIFGSFGRAASSFLTGYLRTTTNMEVVNTEQLPYKEFHNTLVNPVVIGIADLAPLKGTMLMQLSAGTGYSMIDRVLGGPGVEIKRLRDFSEIEKILLERVFYQLIGFLAESWENVLELRPKLEKLETNSQFVQIIAPSEIIALVTLSVKIGSAEGLLNFCIPHMAISPIMDRLNTRLWFSRPRADEEITTYGEDLKVQLEKAIVPLSVVLGKTNIAVNDFINLQVGDIISLDSYISSDLNVMVGNLLKFQGKPGLSRGKNAIQITSLVRKED